VAEKEKPAVTSGGSRKLKEQSSAMSEILGKNRGVNSEACNFDGAGLVIR
jgi:hypothetical protein